MTNELKPCPFNIGDKVNVKTDRREFTGAVSEISWLFGDWSFKVSTCFLKDGGPNKSYRCRSGHMELIERALCRGRAIDELVKHDQEIGLYDAPEWGEPFYGSEAIGRELRGGIGQFFNKNHMWHDLEPIDAYLVYIIYRLPANHPFYSTDLFANAQKPDADHPCRGGE